MNSQFDEHKKQLTEAIFLQFSEGVLLTKPEEETISVDCIYDKNPEEYSPFETDVIETIHRFKFKFEQVDAIPTGTEITMNGDVFIVDAKDHNNNRLRGHSEGDGNMVIVFGRKQ